MALDVSSLEAADKLVTELAPHVGCFKVGLQLITSVGAPQVVEFLHKRGAKVFLDGKFHDIPNTVAEASAAATKLNVSIFNVHASSGVEGMAAAVNAAKKGSSKVLAVTVLTSHSEDNAHLIFGAPSKAKVIQFARDAVLAKVDGIINSPKELSVLGEQPELTELWRATPGIRSSGDPVDDQKRTLSPAEAILAGADWLVIGRPIVKSKSPVESAKRIAAEIEIALQERLHLDLFNLKNIMFGAFKLKLHETNPDAPLSPIYLNIRGLPGRLYSVAGGVLAALAEREGIDDFDYVIGIPNAGEPIGKAFAAAVGKPHICIEKEEFDGGRRITTEILDKFEPGKKVVLVDDLITKAHTKREAIKAVEANGLKVVATLILYDREQGGIAELTKEGHKVCAAARLGEALHFYVLQNKIDQAKKDEVMAYIAAN